MTAPVPASTAVRRGSFSSGDDGEVTEFVRRTYADFTPWPRAGRPGAWFSAVSADVPAIGTDRVRTSMGYSGRAERGFEDYVFYVVHRGGVATESGLGSTSTTAGDVACNPVGLPVAVSARGFETTTIRLSAGLVSRVAEEMSGMPAADLRLRGLQPVSASMGRYWRSVTGMVSGALTDPDSPLSSPLLADDVARTAATAALHVFPNTTMTRQHVPGPGHAAPATIRRAAAYIEAHADQPFRLDEIAAAAGTSVRTLQYGFRRHLGRTPLEHARRVRLERARRDLQAADPSRGDTVAIIARRWGFANAGRFATAYREVYGVMPASTLRD